MYWLSNRPSTSCRPIYSNLHWSIPTERPKLAHAFALTCSSGMSSCDMHFAVFPVGILKVNMNAGSAARDFRLLPDEETGLTQLFWSSSQASCSRRCNQEGKSSLCLRMLPHWSLPAAGSLQQSIAPYFSKTWKVQKHYVKLLSKFYARFLSFCDIQKGAPSQEMHLHYSIICHVRSVQRMIIAVIMYLWAIVAFFFQLLQDFSMPQHLGVIHVERFIWACFAYLHSPDFVHKGIWFLP